MTPDQKNPDDVNGDTPPDFVKKPLGKGPEEESKLDILTRKLYARQESPELQERTRAISDLPTRRGEAYQKPTPVTPMQFADDLTRRATARRRMLRVGAIVGIIVAVFGIALGSTLWYRSAHQVLQDQIGLVINAPEEFVSGEAITYTLQYANTSREEWQKVRVEFEAPTGFHFLGAQPEVRRDGPLYVFDVANVPAGGKGEVKLNGKLIGEVNASLLARATIILAPANDVKGEKDKTVTLTTTIASVPIEMSVEASRAAVSGERLLAIVKVRNTSTLLQESLYLALQVPPGMQLAVEDPEFSPGFDVAGSRWELPAMEPLNEFTYKVVFYVEGATQENRELGVQVGVQENETLFVQRKLSHVVVIAASELVVTQEYNGFAGDQVVAAGQRMEGKVKFRNTGTTGLKSVVLALKLEGVGFDPSTLQLQGGAYNPTTTTITWTSATVPELAIVPAGQEGEIPFGFVVLAANTFPTPPDGGKQNAIVATASIDSPDIITPLGEARRVVSDRTTLSVKTNLTVEQNAFYDDGRLGLTSDGPTPPKVGEQTTYTLRFRFGSTLNDVGDARLIAVLPDGVGYTGKTNLTGGKVDFDERTGEVVWQLPLLNGLTGRTSPAQELHIQVSITPGEDKQNQVIALLKSLKVEAEDLFVDQPVSLQVDPAVSTETAVPGKGRVQ